MPKRAENSLTREEGATVQFKLRMKENLRRKLEESSIWNDTSINTEIVSRLNQTFERDELFYQMLGGRRYAALVRLVLDALRDVTGRLGDVSDTLDETKERQLLAVLVGLGQALSGQKAETLLKSLDLDDTWRESAALAVARHRGVSDLEAQVLVTDPENTDALTAARNYKQPTLKEILGR
jgi:hypothetical protein